MDENNTNLGEAQVEPNGEQQGTDWKASGFVITSGLAGVGPQG